MYLLCMYCCVYHTDQVLPTTLFCVYVCKHVYMIRTFVSARVYLILCMYDTDVLATL